MAMSALVANAEAAMFTRLLAIRMVPISRPFFSFSRLTVAAARLPRLSI
jgi:hypothetical protein